jgi:hypothetical protein
MFIVRLLVSYILYGLSILGRGIQAPRSTGHYTTERVSAVNFNNGGRRESDPPSFIPAIFSPFLVSVIAYFPS